MNLKFCEQFQKLYGKRYMFSNFHQLLHLCMDIRILGLLWTHSCFPFEDKNLVILQLIHGSQKVSIKLSHKYSSVNPDCCRRNHIKRSPTHVIL